MRGHEVLYRHMAGHSDYERTRPVSENDLYDLYSCTKVITMAGVMSLVEQGKLAAAADAYRTAVAADAGYADAHFNLSRLLEAQGDARGALRHLSTFRRLMHHESSYNFV